MSTSSENSRSAAADAGFATTDGLARLGGGLAMVGGAAEGLACCSASISRSRAAADSRRLVIAATWASQLIIAIAFKRLRLRRGLRAERGHRIRAHHRVLVARRGDSLVEEHQRLAVERRRLYPGRKPPFWAVKRPARQYKSAIQKRFTV